MINCNTLLQKFGTVKGTQEMQQNINVLQKSVQSNTAV